MIYISLLIVLISMSACFGKQENGYYQNQDIEDVEKETIKIQLYYESLDSTSINFYMEGFYNTIMKLNSSIELHTYPFGKAMFTDRNQTKVKCEHGENECYGNKILACSIDQLKDPMQYVKYDSCVLSCFSDDIAATNCGKRQGVDYESILKCAKGPRGQELLIYYGKETQNHVFGFTPIILLNGKMWYLGENEFIRDVCQLFNNPPEPCKNIH